MANICNHWEDYTKFLNLIILLITLLWKFNKINKNQKIVKNTKPKKKVKTDNHLKEAWLLNLLCFSGCNQAHKKICAVKAIMRIHKK